MNTEQSNIVRELQTLNNTLKIISHDLGLMTKLIISINDSMEKTESMLEKTNDTVFEMRLDNLKETGKGRANA